MKDKKLNLVVAINYIPVAGVALCDAAAADVVAGVAKKLLPA